MVVDPELVSRHWWYAFWIWTLVAQCLWHVFWILASFTSSVTHRRNSVRSSHPHLYRLHSMPKKPGPLPTSDPQLVLQSGTSENGTKCLASLPLKAAPSARAVPRNNENTADWLGVANRESQREHSCTRLEPSTKPNQFQLRHLTTISYLTAQLFATRKGKAAGFIGRCRLCLNWKNIRSYDYLELEAEKDIFGPTYYILITNLSASLLACFLNSLTSYVRYVKRYQIWSIGKHRNGSSRIILFQILWQIILCYWLRPALYRMKPPCWRNACSFPRKEKRPEVDQKNSFL